MKNIGKHLLTLAALLALSPAAWAQLQWNSYDKVGGSFTTNVATGGDATYGGSVTFTIPASTETVFTTETFAPITLSAGGQNIVVDFSMTADGGLYPGSTGRLLGMGLLNDPGTPSTAVDDTGYWTDFNTGNPSFELFYRPSGLTTFFQFDSSHKLGSSTVKTGQPTNGVTYGMQFQINMNSAATGITVGTSTGSFATAGAAMTNGNTTQVNELADASTATLLTTLPTTTFNEFAFEFANTSASPVHVTLSGITLVPANPVIAPGGQPLGYSGSPGDNTPGSTFTIALNATSGTPLSYQWYEATATATNTVNNGATGDGSTISGATNSTLSFTDAQVADSGSYFVVVTNPYGSVTSSSALLNISASDFAPTITSIAPTNATIIAGQGTNITVAALGAPSPDFYWYDGSSNLLQSGPSATLTLANVQPANAGTYTVVATNSIGSASTNFVINVIVTPSFSTQPTNLLLNVGDPATFTAAASGTPTPTYQWYKNAHAILNATGSSYSIASVATGDIGTYTVVASNDAGSTPSTPAILAEYSDMNGTPSGPTNNATGVCVDTHLAISFDQTPSVGTTGSVNIYDASNPGTPVDTLNLAATGNNLQLRTIGGINLNAYDILINGNTAVIYPHAGVLTIGKTYYVTIDPGVIVDANGAYFTGVSGSSSWTFGTKSTGPTNPTNIVVAADGSGDFATVQGAIDSVPPGNTTPTAINIRNGLYTEVDRVNGKNNITFIGQSRIGTMIAYANNNNINGSTSTRPMFGVTTANDIAIENIMLTNSTPHGGSQAETLFVNTAKRFIALDCTICSYQDTLLVNQSGDQAYIQDSHIQGDTDYIWGSGTLYATNDELMAMSVQSYLTQARTAQNTNGFAFVNCRIFGANSGINNGALGRDGGSSGVTASFPYGNVAYISCTMDTNLIIPAGWVLGSGTTQGTETANLRFWEYQSVDTNGNPVNVSSRVAWSTQLDAFTATNDVENVTNWLYGWQPALAPAILANPASAVVGGGTPASFAVTAIGISSPTYLWLLNGNPLATQTNATLSIAAAGSGDAGSYTVQVSNGAGSVTSSPAVLTVVETGPTLTPTAYANGQFSFTVSGQSGPNYIIQVSTDLNTWQSIATNTTPTLPYTFNDTNASGTAQYYRVQVGP